MNTKKTDVYLIRHGATKGNLEGRYVGRTDEEITDEEKESLHILAGKISENMRPDKVYVSPMKRCIQTAEILFPDSDLTVVEDFRECDFGEFEYMNYSELNGNPAYQRYIDSGGKTAFPQGEDMETFQERCVNAFAKIMEEYFMEEASFEKRTGSVAMVVHGGTIMSILDEYSQPHRDYFEWQCKNAEGYKMVFEDGWLYVISRL